MLGLKVFPISGGGGRSRVPAVPGAYAIYAQTTANKFDDNECHENLEVQVIYTVAVFY